MYSYDPVGTIESVPYACHGAGTRQVDPFFDNQVNNFWHFHWICLLNIEIFEIGGVNLPEKPKLTKERAQKLMRDAFRSVAERETTTGDCLYMITLEKGQKPKEERIRLRED